AVAPSGRDAVVRLACLEQRIGKPPADSNQQQQSDAKHNVGELAVGCLIHHFAFGCLAGLRLGSWFGHRHLACSDHNDAPNYLPATAIPVLSMVDSISPMPAYLYLAASK